MKLFSRSHARLPVLLLILALGGCGGSSDSGNATRRGPGGRNGGPGRIESAPASSPAVPVQVTRAALRPISQHLETNGVLSAENEVDLVARVSGPIVELLAEEGMDVSKGQLLARIDDRELRNQVAVSQVNRDEAQRALDRSQASWDSGLIAREAYDAALSALETATTQLESARIQLGYTRIEAPFDGVISTRYIKLAEHVQNGQALFRLCDFRPLLCPIQVPERQLRSLQLGQRATISVEAFPDERFSARVLRIRPTVDAATGTITVTLDVDGRGRLRPGMFASVALEVATHDQAVVIPKTALVLDSIGDTVFVKDGDTARRREVVLGFRSADDIEVVEGLQANESVIVLGQEGLSDGTPVMELNPGSTAQAPVAVADTSPSASGPAATVGTGEASQPAQRASVDPAETAGREGADTAAVPAAMAAQPGPPGQAPPGEQPPPPGPGQGQGWRRGGFGQGGPPGGPGGGPPPQLLERLRNASPEQLEGMKERMRQRGMTNEQIENLIKQAREGGST